MKIIKIAKEITLEMVKDPNCPPELLTEVLRRGKDDWVSRYAANNPNVPPELLTEVLRRGKDDWVSRYAARNPNCPPEEKWLWKNTASNPLGYLDYLDASPEIKNNPKITMIVKKELVKLLSDNFNKLFPVPQAPFNKKQSSKVA